MSRAKYLDGVLIQRTGPLPPSFEQVRGMIQPFCLAHPEILRLEAFGSVADGEASAGSDVDLLATFKEDLLPDGLAYFGYLDALREELAALLAVPVDLGDRSSAERLENPYRREGILGSARTLYEASRTGETSHGS